VLNNPTVARWGQGERQAEATTCTVAIFIINELKKLKKKKPENADIAANNVFFSCFSKIVKN